MYKSLISSFMFSLLFTAYSHTMYNKPTAEELTSKSCDVFHTLIYQYFSSNSYTRATPEEKAEMLKKIKACAKECKARAKATEDRVKKEAKNLEELGLLRPMSKEDKEFVRQMNRSEQESSWDDPFQVYLNRADRKAEKRNS